MIDWKWVLGGVLAGAAVGFFMGQKATGGRMITGQFGAPFQSRIDRGQ